MIGLRMRQSRHHRPRHDCAATTDDDARSRPHPCGDGSCDDDDDDDDSDGSTSLLYDRIGCMRRQERTAYRCDNYMARRDGERAATKKRRADGHGDGDGGDRRSPSAPRFPSPPSSACVDEDMADCSAAADCEGEEKLEKREPVQERGDREQRHHHEQEQVDPSCREKMCSWSYRIVDHFQADREIVSVAFSCLDRFLDRCSCDRTAFKLAAIACLHVASKVRGGPDRFVSAAGLAELSRGEFDADHIAEMERIVLQTLKWRISPPTTRTFAAHFVPLLGDARGERVPRWVRATVLSRALFFAELSVYDYFLVAENPSVVAYAAVLNALEGVLLLQHQHHHQHHRCSDASASDDDGGGISRRIVSDFHASIRRATGMHYEEYSMEALRARLWQLYTQSEQFRIEHPAPVPAPTSGSSACAPHHHHHHHLMGARGAQQQQQQQQPPHVMDKSSSAEEHKDSAEDEDGGSGDCCNRHSPVYVGITNFHCQ